MARQAGTPPEPKTAAAKTADLWDKLDKVARILSLIAVPVVIAIVGWFVQNSLSDRNVSQEYVKLALSILKEPKDKIEPSLRDWAVDLLNQNSPTKFSAQVVKALKAGEATLPVPTAASQESRFGMACAMPPDVEVSHLAAEIENRLKGSAEYSNIRSRRGSPYSPAEITIEADIGSAQMPFARSTTAITQDSSAVTLIHVIEGSFAQYVYAAPTGDLLPENLVKGLREYLDQIVGKDKVKCGPFEQGLVRRVLSPMHPLQRY